MCQVCGTMAGNGQMVGQEDRQGCLLSLNHKGGNEFADQNGIRWQWETDLEGDCDHCMQFVGD